MNTIRILKVVLTLCVFLGFAAGAATAVAAPWDNYKKPSQEVLKKKLTEMEYYVTQEDGTEPKHYNDYHSYYKKKGIFVDILSGAPLFSTTEQFDSGSGWPAFKKPIDMKYIELKKKFSFFGETYEVRSKTSDSHLGDRFTDGPPPTHLRYCIDAVALRFIPYKDMKKEGYGAYLYLFKK